MNDDVLWIFYIISIVVIVCFIIYILYMGTEKKYVEYFLKIFEDNDKNLYSKVNLLDYIEKNTKCKNEIVYTDNLFKKLRRNGIKNEKLLNSIIVHEILKINENEPQLAVIYYPLLSSPESSFDKIKLWVEKRIFYSFRDTIRYVQETEAHYDMRTQGIHVNNSPGTQVISGSNIQGPVQNNPVIHVENSQPLNYAIQLLHSSIDSYQDSGIQADDERRIASKILENLRSNKIPSEKDETYIKDQIDRSPWLKKIITEAMNKTLDKLAGATIPDAIDWLAGLVGIS